MFKKLSKRVMASQPARKKKKAKPVKWATLLKRNRKQIAELEESIYNVVKLGQHERVREVFLELKKLHEANGAGCQHPVNSRCGMDSVCDACGAWV